jgi:hypothetical protein
MRVIRQRANALREESWNRSPALHERMAKHRGACPRSWLYYAGATMGVVFTGKIPAIDSGRPRKDFGAELFVL